MAEQLTPNLLIRVRFLSASPICYHKLIKDLYGWRCIYCSKRFEQNIIR